MARGYDEPFLYGLVASEVETDAARSCVTFTIDPAALLGRRAITPQDVIFSWQLLRDKGRPNHRTYYAKVAKAEAIGERAVRIRSPAAMIASCPLILGLMPVLARRGQSGDLRETSFTAPLRRPLSESARSIGQSVSVVRDPNYWGRELAINRGFWNFDEVRFDFYRDANSHLEAFKRGLYDWRSEQDPGRWQTAYDFPALREGRVVKEAFPTGLPKPSFFYVFNTRRPIFADSRVREAIALLFDFEWINHNLFFDLYRRTASYFDGSELSAHKRPADARERALLAPFPDAVRPDVMDGTWSPAVNDGSGRDRAIRTAPSRCSAAGYELRGTTCWSGGPGSRSAEIMVTSRDERLALPSRKAAPGGDPARASRWWSKAQALTTSA